MGPLEVAPILSAPQFQYSGFQQGEPNGWQAPPPYVPSPRVLAESQRSTPDSNTQLQLSQQQPLFTAARLSEHDAQLSAEQLSAARQASVLRTSESLQQQPEPQSNLGMLRKSLSMGREPHTQKEALRALKKIQRSSSGSMAKLPNSLPGSLSDTEAGAFSRPAGALAEADTLGRGSGSSTMSGSIFGGSCQWVIEYSDLVSAVETHASLSQLHLTRVHLIIQKLLLPCFSELGAHHMHCCFDALTLCNCSPVLSRQSSWSMLLSTMPETASQQCSVSLCMFGIRCHHDMQSIAVP